MQSWPRPEVPRVPDVDDHSRPPLLVHDTATGALRDLTPSGPEARLYVCGITPYDATHLGHAATYLAFDLLQRQWLDLGHTVHYVQNVTDVDDPLLERATATGQDWVALAERETQLFREDMTALQVLPPRHYIGAVESIPLVTSMIGQLDERGATYRVDEDLYFRVHADPDFGVVSGYDQDTRRRFFAERGGDPDRPGKDDPFDCLLWQADRPGEPSWPSPYGPGRPGWHIECAAIALHHLGPTIDVQGGGSDLIFPHHEMSAAQAAVATGAPFARAYVHTGMVGYEGEKMSKSRGNLVLVSRLRENGHDPMAIRLALLAHHHRADWEWHDEEIVRAETRLATWRAAARASAAADAGPVIEAVRAALRQDLDAPRALDVVDAWAASSGHDTAAPARMSTAVNALLGVLL